MYIFKTLLRKRGKSNRRSCTVLVRAESRPHSAPLIARGVINALTTQRWTGLNCSPYTRHCHVSARAAVSIFRIFLIDVNGLKARHYSRNLLDRPDCAIGAAFRSVDLWWLPRISRLSWLGTTWNTRQYRPRSLGSPRLLNIGSNRIRDTGPWHSFATELGIHQPVFDVNINRYNH